MYFHISINETYIQTDTQLGFYAKYRTPPTRHPTNILTPRHPPRQRCHPHGLRASHLCNLHHPRGPCPAHPSRFQPPQNLSLRLRRCRICNRILSPGTHCRNTDVTLPIGMWVLRTGLADTVPERHGCKICCYRKLSVLDRTVHGSWVGGGTSAGIA